MKFAFLLSFFFLFFENLAAQNTSLSNDTPAINYINFELKNNSWKRLHLYVKGPQKKPFSYGFPLNPGQKRAENWPVGSKVYFEGKENSEKYLVIIKADDAGQVVKLFDNKKISR